MNSSKKIAIIGTGAIGSVLAKNFATNQQPYLIADRSIEKASQLANAYPALAKPTTINDAILEADVIIFAVWFAAIKELIQEYAHLLNGKLIVDPSNPIAPDANGGFVKIIPADVSAGEELNALLPQGAALVKALGTLSAASLSNASNQQPEKALLFYALNDRSYESTIKEVVYALGFEPYYVGGLDQSLRLEVFGELHEFGALGKTITLSEYAKK